MYAVWQLVQLLPELHVVRLTPVIERLVAQYACGDIFVPVMEVPTSYIAYIARRDWWAEQNVSK